jgi:glycosyltransferase involved in cell wall biosynthesis
MSLFVAILCSIVALPVAVFFIETVAAFILVTKKPELHSSKMVRHRVAVVIPARNESVGILPTLSDVKPQLLPGDRLLVVADNCTDDTAAVASGAGAEVIERHELSRRGKGFALNFALKHIKADPPAVVIIVDADCRVSEETIDHLASACTTTGRPVQILDLMTAPEGSPVNFCVAEFAWRVKNWVRPLGLGALGLPCQLMGTGMAFPWEVIRSANLASGSIVEDTKLGLELARAGHPPLFFPAARVTSDFQWSAVGDENQRRRWEERNHRI